MPPQQGESYAICLAGRGRISDTWDPFCECLDWSMAAESQRKLCSPSYATSLEESETCSEHDSGKTNTKQTAISFRLKPESPLLMIPIVTPSMHCGTRSMLRNCTSTRRHTTAC